MTRSPVQLFRFWSLAILCVALMFAFISLGTWQVHRRAWKLTLIEHVNERIKAAPIAPPGPAQWPDVTLDNDGYRRITLHGSFIPGKEVLAQAVTAKGGGYWVLAPMQTDQGFTVLINRGFVDPAHKAPDTHAAPTEPVTVTGLLRITEPGGGFLRNNDPAHDQWHSRDVAAIGEALGIPAAQLAPYFIDEEATGAPGYPITGLTVVKFHNSHLIYLLTWYSLALLSAYSVLKLYREEFGSRPDDETVA